jgi:hypothetical protein
MIWDINMVEQKLWKLGKLSAKVLLEPDTYYQRINVVMEDIQASGDGGFLSAYATSNPKLNIQAC